MKIFVKLLIALFLLLIIAAAGLYFGYKGGITFAAGVDREGNLQLVHSDELTHTNMLLMWQAYHGRLYNLIEGRIWTDVGVLAIWNDVASSDVEVIEELFHEVADIDISNYLFVSEFDSEKAFAISVGDFEKLGLSNEWDENDWNKLLSFDKRENGVKKQNISTKNGLGFDDRDYMRHYLYSEEKNK